MSIKGEWILTSCPHRVKNRRMLSRTNPMQAFIDSLHAFC